VNFAAMGVGSSQQDLAIGGGAESMSRAPMGSDGAGADGNNEILREKVFQVPQGISADLIATIEGFSREDVDRFALQSQKRAQAAQEACYFSKSLVPVKDPKTGEVVLEKDEHPRAGTTLEGLAKLDAVFTKFGASPATDDGETWDQVALRRYRDVASINHVHTAGNASGIVDGAAAVLVASDDYVKAHGLKPRARIRSTATYGSEPVIMLTAPAPTSERALAKAGMSASDIDLWEINEAFAAIPLQTMKKLGISDEKVNVNGGAIALGHPLGATGALLLGTALDELERRDLTSALITLCIGGGMGIATIIERV
jgi:acetyl-CoA C-acetyltransferase